MNGLNIITIIAGVAALVCIILTIFILCLYIEKKRNVDRLENELDALMKKSRKSIEEKDAIILELQTEKDTIMNDAQRLKDEAEQKILDSEESMLLIKEQTEAIVKENTDNLKAIEEYQTVIVELIKDMHELEEAYINNDGDLRRIYADYDEYFG